jgi:hypothetical protein
VVPSAAYPAWRAWERARSLGRAARPVTSLRDEANANTFRGLLALERGDVDEAEVAFRLALDLWQGGAGLDFKARPLAEDGLRWLGSSPDKETRRQGDKETR